MIDIKSATTAELVAWYNLHSGRVPIKKFVNRPTAENRCAALQAAMTTHAIDQKPRSAGTRHSDAIKQSWAIAAVAKQRKTRHRVLVDGKEFRSVRAAYVAFKLPLNEHIQFRMLLKQRQRLENYGKVWVVVPAKTRKS